MSGGRIQGARHDGESVALVMDMGGNWIRVALATRAGKIVWVDKRPTNVQEGKTAVVACVDALLQQGIIQAGSRRITGMGMGVAGPVDVATGTMYNPPNIPVLDGVSFKSLWENRVSWPILVGNDATLAAMGEYHYGAGVGSRTLVYITISTGIGGGIVVDGRPLMGANGMAGELGHMSIDRNGPLCSCGHTGCLESFASGTAIAQGARKRVAGKTDSLLWNMASGDLSLISAETVFVAAVRGDPVAIEVLEDATHALGAGLVNVLHIFNPDAVVIGGGVSNNWDYLRPGVEAYIKTNAMSHVQKYGYRLTVSSLGDNIGLLGAAALVWQSED